jgi:hypothetical protein
LAGTQPEFAVLHRPSSRKRRGSFDLRGQVSAD